MQRFNSAGVLALAIVAVLGLAGPIAAGERLPFVGYVEGERTERTVLSPTVVKDRWDMGGTATLLGNFEMVVTVVVDFGSFPITGEGTATFVAANGDKIFADVTGSSKSADPGFIWITENGVITGGTGRFAGVTGSYTSVRLTSLVTNETLGGFEGTISPPGS